MTSIVDSVEIAGEKLPEVRKISSADLDWALAAGWDDFKSKRGDLLFAGLFYPIIGFTAAIFALNADLLVLLFPLLAGVSILGPAVASGFYELARRRESGLPTGWRWFFQPVKGRRRTPIIVLTVCLAAVFVAWMFSAWLIYLFTLGGQTSPGSANIFQQIFTTDAGWTLILIGNLVGFMFAVFTLVFSVVSFPMVVDRPVDAGTAIATSFKATRKNKRAIAGWGLRIAVLLFLGALPLFIGLAVVLPVLGYATWHLYTRLVVRETI
ncbi:MAG: DUF2189 domain-containing protein [Sphingomonadaceae bacterium]